VPARQQRTPGSAEIAARRGPRRGRDRGTPSAHVSGPTAATHDQLRDEAHCLAGRVTAAKGHLQELLHWHDDDIIDQIGDGGVEVRSDCALDIVLAFHHDSLLREIPMAEASVVSHTSEGRTASLSRSTRSHV